MFYLIKKENELCHNVRVTYYVIQLIDMFNTSNKQVGVSVEDLDKIVKLIVLILTCSVLAPIFLVIFTSVLDNVGMCDLYVNLRKG